MRGSRSAPPKIDGISYFATLSGESKQPEHDYLYWEFYERGGKQAVRWGKWKGIRLDVATDPNGPLELYDLDADPSEKTNVAQRYPDIVARLTEMMNEAHVDSPIFQFN